MLCRQIWRFLPVWTTFKDRQDGIFLLNKNHNLKSQQLAPLLGQIWWLIQGRLELVMFCDFYRQFYQITPLLVTAYTTDILSYCHSVCLPIFLSVWLIVDILNNFCFDNKAGKDSTTNTSTNICALSFTDIVLKRQNVSESYDFPGDISDTENLKLPRVIAEDPPLRRVGPVFFPRLHF